MKKDYISPELELVRYTLRDVLTLSPTESEIGENIGGGEGGGDDGVISGLDGLD